LNFPIAFDSSYRLPLEKNHRFPMEKYELLPQQLLLEGSCTQADFFIPKPATKEQVLRVHQSNYVARSQWGTTRTSESKDEEKRVK